jgi:hypothetical protein
LEQQKIGSGYDERPTPLTHGAVERIEEIAAAAARAPQGALKESAAN